MIDNEDLLKALDRIARTPDGELLYLYFQRVQMEVIKDGAPDSGALWVHHGRRSLAAEMMGRMAKGIEESGRPADQPDAAARHERPIVFVSRAPAAVNRHEYARDYIRRTDPEFARSGDA